jgi:hypothetical protein
MQKDLRVYSSVSASNDYRVSKSDICNSYAIWSTRQRSSVAGST